MRRSFALVIAVAAWFAVVAQYYLMVNNRVSSVLETTIAFFSFFTILTNSIVAVYFSSVASTSSSAPYLKNGTLTAITVYITVVGLVYQVLLRHTWNPTGMQKLVDEFLHTVIPLLVILFWARFGRHETIRYSQLPKWLLYPLFYLVYILIRGYFSGTYPYPFIDAATIGYTQTSINAAGILVLFVVLSLLFITVARNTPASK